MENKKFKFDVAFSFLKEDESLANNINELLKGRLETFLYSKEQEEIAGTDGEKTFNKVFGEDSRLVVVLYRKSWGLTSWTRIEETAIRNRAFNEGYDFTIFIPLDTSPEVPKWLPKNRIWIGLDRWGIDGAASVIKARVQEANGTIHEESAEDKASRLNFEINKEQKRKKFLDSSDGVAAARKEVGILFNEIEIIVKNITEKNENIFMRVERDTRNEELIITSKGFKLRFEWNLRAGNMLLDSALIISLWQRPSRYEGREKSQKIVDYVFEFDTKGCIVFGWEKRKGDNQLYSSKKLANLQINEFVERVYR